MLKGALITVAAVVVGLFVYNAIQKKKVTTAA